jgi:hypothetical protein
LTGSYVEGPNGPIMGELLEMFPDAPTILRPGPISAWDDPNFVKVVEGLGRKKLIMVGVTIDVVSCFPFSKRSPPDSKSTQSAMHPAAGTS